MFFWFRGQTFYQNPLLSGLFISNERKSKILSYTLLVLIIGYPISYTTYSMSHFWLQHHEYNYLVDDYLCYENYTNGSIAPINEFHDQLSRRNLTELDSVSGSQHGDPVPMIVSSGLQFFQFLLHVLVIIPFLIPFVRFVKDQDRDMPEVNTLLRKCLTVTVMILVVNLLTWVLGHLLAPFMPVSKFLLDAIADSRICLGMIMASLTMSNWSKVLIPWRNDDFSRNSFLDIASVNKQSNNRTVSTVINMNNTAVDL